jgi:hypothetical protein
MMMMGMAVSEEARALMLTLEKKVAELQTLSAALQDDKVRIDTYLPGER